MFGTIRHHQKWLWIVIATLTIISFLAYFNPASRNRNGAPVAGVLGYVGGQPVSQDQFNSVLREVALRYLLRSSSLQWPDTQSPELQHQAWVQLFLIQKQKELGIHVSTEAAADMAQNRILIPMSQMLKSPINFQDFVEKILKPVGLDADDFDRFLRHDLGRQQLAEAAALTGRLITPQEAETVYRREHEELATIMLPFTASNYLGSVSVTPELIGQFYSNRVSIYRIPDRVQVSYVKFNVTNYMPAARTALTNLDQLADDAFRKYGTNRFPDAKTPDEAKAKWKDLIVQDRAMSDAHKVVVDFADELDKKQTHSLASFEDLAKSKSLTVGVTASFDRDNGPADLNVQETFARAAFKLTPDDPYAGPVKADDGYYEIALKQQIPSEVPQLKSIEARVTDDYKNLQALQLSLQAAVKIGGILSNGLAAGKSFDALCAEAGAKPLPVPPFSLSTQTLADKLKVDVGLDSLKQAALATPVGKISQPLRMREGAFLLYVEKRLPVDEAKLKQDLPGFLAMMRQGRVNETFNNWLNDQARLDPQFQRAIQPLNEEIQSRRSATARAQ